MNSADIKSHGLDGNLVKPDWPVLRLEELDRLLARFPQIKRTERIVSFSPRPFSAASVVETPTGKLFVKRHHHEVRDRESLLEEHLWLAYLSSRTSLVKPPLQDRSGETAIEIGSWTYEVHPVGDGLDVYEQSQAWTPFLNAAHAQQAGRALARLHAASAGYAAPARKVAPLVTSFTIFASDDLAVGLVRYAEQRPALRAYLAKRDWVRESLQTFLPLHKRLKPFLSHVEPLWTHNDFHASNLLWSDDTAEAKVAGVIDVGLADRTTALHDIATAIERNGIEWLQIHDSSRDPFHPAQIIALLGGYEEVRPLWREQAEALVALLPVVHAEFALTEADYFLRALNSEPKADLAYAGYFLGHAKWFATDSGKRLLAQLQAWAERHSGGWPSDAAEPQTAAGTAKQ